MPNVVSAGHASMRMSSVIATSVSGTSSASAATLVAKIRSKVRVTRRCSFREGGDAAGGDRADHVLRLGHDGGGQRRVSQVLREPLALVRAPPEVASDRDSLRLVLDLCV